MLKAMIRIWGVFGDSLSSPHQAGVLDDPRSHDGLLLT